jgi:hypothetical protein
MATLWVHDTLASVESTLNDRSEESFLKFYQRLNLFIAVLSIFRHDDQFVVIIIEAMQHG